MINNGGHTNYEYSTMDIFIIFNIFSSFTLLTLIPFFRFFLGFQKFCEVKFFKRKERKNFQKKMSWNFFCRYSVQKWRTDNFFEKPFLAKYKNIGHEYFFLSFLDFYVFFFWKNQINFVTLVMWLIVSIDYSEFKQNLEFVLRPCSLGLYFS